MKPFEDTTISSLKRFDGAKMESAVDSSLVVCKRTTLFPKNHPQSPLRRLPSLGRLNSTESNDACTALLRREKDPIKKYFQRDCELCRDQTLQSNSRICAYYISPAAWY
ncbi:hypothetical protein PENVUL_c062G03393 [Penicillium vulpinum]|uniref:Uncharacterized protein n=1 Tax=Penicillium vulpinum TaxID=29845 RepID=A0A1V6RE67_9EURO|nr:hypothetical protein PENVUL_c062G03393 [Penicillium vulpinum]